MRYDDMKVIFWNSKNKIFEDVSTMGASTGMKLVTLKEKVMGWWDV